MAGNKKNFTPFCVLVLFVISSACGAPVRKFQGRTYSTNWGDLAFTAEPGLGSDVTDFNNIDGVIAKYSYKWQNAIITGAILGSYNPATRTLFGKWEDSDGVLCSTAGPTGSKYHGTYQLKFSPDLLSFEGLFGTCDGPLDTTPKGRWEGTLLVN